MLAHRHRDFARCERSELKIGLRTMPGLPQVILNMFLTRRREAAKIIVQEAMTLRLRVFARVHNALEYKRFAASIRTKANQS